MSRHSVRRSAAVLGALTALVSSPGFAQVSAPEGLERLGASDWLRVAGVRLGEEPRVPVVVRHRERWAGEQPLTAVSPSFSGGWLTASELAALRAQHPAWRAEWSPPRHVLLDRAAVWTRAGEFRVETGRAGGGAVVGVIDTGIDAAHPDFQNLDGTSRIAWLLDFSRSPAGLHPALEESFGCTTLTPCAIYSAADIDAANAMGRSVTSDSFGHGTHVTSLAAGNGLATDPSRYIGVAPEARLIIVRGDRGASGSFYDADILLGTRFIFERAEELGLPAVVNLSLGSDFGAHDGSSALEEGLAEFVGDDLPGRAIVVAAGNSGAVYDGLLAKYPDPWGTHTEVHVPHSSSVRVPIITPKSNKQETNGRVFVWITMRPGDALDVGLDDGDGEWIPPLEYGRAASFKRGDLTVTIFDGQESLESPLTVPNAAVVVLDGSWKAGETFALRLEGHGSASVWLQSDGDLSPSSGSIGALVPRALKEGTINLPGSHPELIAVGATINRLSWPTRDGSTIKVSSFGSVENPPADGTAYFSSAGPNAIGVMKPEISAPGAFLVGAMSRLADPARTNNTGIFAGAGVCSAGADCLVVDDYHAVTTGTSMAAPQVAGAVALLLEGDPSLTQSRVRALLQAGARPLGGIVALEQQTGAGALDTLGALEAQLLEGGVSGDAASPDAARSWMSVAASFAHPDPAWPFDVYLELRTASGHIADQVSGDDLELRVGNGSQPEKLTRIAPGVWRARVAADAGSGGKRLGLEARFRGEMLVRRSVPIAVDAHLVDVVPRARGGCQQASGEAANGLWLLLCALGLGARRRYSMSTR
ncbi:MAG: S8 family serine peptidase [Myxococcales bacterium]|nr:S8 family serine peptidase [Myxococcales bacterium]